MIFSMRVFVKVLLMPRPLAASLVLFAGWHLLLNLTMFPAIGVNTYMTTKVSKNSIIETSKCKQS